MEQIRRFFKSDISFDVVFTAIEDGVTQIKDIPKHVKIEYFTDRNWDKFIVERNGRSTKNCKINGSKLTVYLPLSKMSLGTGELKCMLTEYVKDASFPGGERAITKLSDTNILLWTGEDSVETVSFEHIIDSTSVNAMTITTYTELLNEKNNGELIAGMHYRITDFVTTTKQTGTQSAMHPYDIIVQALDEHTLSENAQAIQREGDTYFAKSNLKAWRLKYSLEGDASRFAWTKDAARNQSWQCTWGVLESKPSNEASSNYTIAQIEGQTKYLYRPDSPSTFLESKQFYRMVGKETIYVEDYQDVAFVTTESPFDVGGESLILIAIHMPTTQILGTWPSSSDWGGEEEYNVGFGEEDGSIFDMVTNGSTIEIAGQTYFSWKPYGEDYEMISSWICDNNPFVVSEGTKEYYNGDNNSLFYAFDTVLPRATTYVREVSDGVHLYNCEGEETFDYITYKSFVPQEDGGKGVVYRLIDEFGNDCPYDFKNIQFLDNGSYFYTFDAYGTDASLAASVCDNKLEHAGNLLHVTIFKSTSKHNRIQRVTNSGAFIFEQSATYNDIKAVSDSAQISAKGGFDNNTLLIRASLTANGVFSNNFAQYLSSTMVITGDMYACKVDTLCRNNVPLKINVGRIQQCVIYGCGTFSIKNSNGDISGAIGYSTINLGMNGSNIKLVWNTTSSLNTRIEGLDIKAFNWGTTEVSVDITNHPVNATYPLTIARNKDGEVKVWSVADLV